MRTCDTNYTPSETFFVNDPERTACSYIEHIKLKYILNVLAKSYFKLNNKHQEYLKIVKALSDKQSSIGTTLKQRTKGFYSFPSVSSLNDIRSHYIGIFEGWFIGEIC